MKNFLTTVFLFAVFTIAVFPQSEIPDPNMWVTDGTVEAIAVDGNYTYIGGSFAYVGPNTGAGAKLTTTSVSPDLSFPKVNGHIYVAVPDGGGGWFIGGAFTKVGTYVRNRIARINSDGTVDATWNPNANQSISTIAISGTDIYVSGSFTSIGGQARNYIAKLNNTTGAADLNWQPNADSYVSAIAISGSDIYVGGGFTFIGGQVRNGIAKLNNTTGAPDLTWDPNAFDNYFFGPGTFSAIAISGSDIYVSGLFTSIGGETRNGIAKLNNTTGAADPTWDPLDPNSYGSIITIAISGSDIYVGGGFSSIGGQTRNNIAKLNNTTGAADPTWNPNANNSVNTIAISGSDIYVGGTFTSIGGEMRKYIAKLNNTTGTADLTWNLNVNGFGIFIIAISETNIYVGGNFLSIGGQTRRGIAKLNNITGAADLNWNANANSYVSVITISGSDIYVGGGFTSIGGQTRNRIAKLNNTIGAADLTWNPNASSTVNEIAISGSDIYVGGAFTSIGGQSRNRIAKLNNTTGAADLTWNPNASSGVYSIAISGSEIYVGGFFLSIGGQTRNRIAKLNNTTGAVDLTWNPNAGGGTGVQTIALSGSDIYVGGSFTSIGGQTRNLIAKLNNSTGAADLTWNPNANSTSTVESIVISGSDIYAGGSFTSIGGQTRRGIAKLNNTTGAVDLTWNPNADGSVYAIAINGSDIYVGGNFLQVGGNWQQRLALFRGESVTNTPPQFVSPTPDEASTITVYTGSQINFTVSAEDADAGDNVILTAIGLPSGSSMVLPASGNPASSDFSWTPSVADVGNYSLTFTATDNSSASLTRSFTVEVIAQNTTPYFVYPTPDEASTITVYTGSEIIFTVSAEDADAGDIVMLTANGLPSGSSMVIPASGNPASSDFSWTPLVADVGTYPLAFTASDNSSAAATRSFILDVVELNVSPEFVSPTPECGTTLTVEEGSPINFTISAADLNSADVIILSVSGLPAGSSMDPSLPANGNPVSSLFSWIPSSADVGNHTIVYTADDNSNDPVTCSLLVEVTPKPPPPTNYCPLSQGYWKTHTNNWPAGVLPMMLGTLNTYDQSELLSLFNAAPRGDASIILAHQLMAAKLNVANGSPLPTEVQDAIEDADSAIGELEIPAGIKQNHPLRATMIELSSLLDDYNNQLLTPNCVQMPKNGTGKSEVITEYALFSNYPNPFNPTTKISWQAPADGKQTLKVFDVLGKEVAVLTDEFRPAGRYETTFDASNLASGIYIYKLQAGEFIETKKMILMK